MTGQTKTRSPTRLHGVATLLGDAAWAIREGTHRQFVGDFNAYLRSGGGDQLEQWREAKAHRAEALEQTQAAAPGVAVIPLYGTILPRGNIMVDLCGAASPHSFAEAVLQAAQDPNITSIILDIDSGGGAIAGIDVAAMAVRRAAGLKPVTAVCNTTMCSAALWIGAQAREIVVTPAGEIGSIGVIGTHMDQSAVYDEAGLVVTYVRSVPGKALGQSTEAMEGEVLAEWQSQVDRLHTLFVEAVAQGRGQTPEFVRESWATGAVWFGAEAVTAGLADRVGTLSEVAAGHLQEAARQQAQQGRQARRAADPAYGQFAARVRQLEEGAGHATPPQAGTLNMQGHALYAELDAACLTAASPETFEDLADLRARVGEITHATAQAARAAPSQEDPPMKTITLTAQDGTTHEIENTPEAIQAFLASQLGAQAEANKGVVTLAEEAAAERVTAARNAHLIHLGGLFGLTPEQATGADLAPWQGAASRAAAVGDYRTALLSELEALAVTVDGNTGAAAQIVKLAGPASLPDLLATVTAYRERRDALVPDGRQSALPVTGTEGGEEKKVSKVRYDRN